MIEKTQLRIVFNLKTPSMPIYAEPVASDYAVFGICFTITSNRRLCKKSDDSKE